MAITADISHRQTGRKFQPKIWRPTLFLFINISFSEVNTAEKHPHSLRSPPNARLSTAVRVKKSMMALSSLCTILFFPSWDMYVKMNRHCGDRSDWLIIPASVYRAIRTGDSGGSDGWRKMRHMYEPEHHIRRCHPLRKKQAFKLNETGPGASMINVTEIECYISAALDYYLCIALVGRCWLS